MQIIPAIDLLDGKVVRLYQGKKENVKVYSEDPLAIVEKFKTAGANLIHLVDLNAAFDEGDNLQLIEEIIQKTKVNLQVGGGIRDFRKVSKMINIGVSRIVVGTKSLDENFLATLLKFCKPELIAVGVDVLDGECMAKGWKERTGINYLDFIEKIQNKNINWLIYTDISRDGTLQGINFSQLESLKKFSKLNIIISGGVSSLEDLTLLNKKFPWLFGVIIGKAIYENTIDLKLAISRFSSQ